MLVSWGRSLWNLHVLLVLARILYLGSSFLPLSKDICVRLIGDLKKNVYMYVSVTCQVSVELTLHPAVFCCLPLGKAGDCSGTQDSGGP